MTSPTTYKLILQPLPDETDVDGVRRLRGLLKAALRQYRLRAVRVEPWDVLRPVGTPDCSHGSQDLPPAPRRF